MIPAARRLALLFFLLRPAVPAAPAPDPWVRIRSAHFELFTSAGGRAGRDLALHFEQIRGFFLQAFGAKSPDEKTVRIIAFHSDREFQPYRPSAAATAFFYGGGERDYIVMSNADSQQYPVATHEYLHLLISQVQGAVPLWLNEGLAELYSTSELAGDRVVIGKAPPGRAQSLFTERWIPLSSLISVAHDSPLYNEKSRAGMFYAESWALVHMLNLDRPYRSRLGALLDALKTVDSAAAFEQAYGKSPAQVQADLEEYVRRQYLHGVAFPAPGATAAALAEEPNAGLAAHIALAEMVADHAGKAAQAAEMYTRLERDFPRRWEVEASFGRFAWRERRDQEALTHFARAAGLDADDPRLYIDYARALNVTGHPAEAVATLRKAIALDASCKDAHYELGLALLRGGAWRDAIEELQLARPLKAPQASRYFYGMAYAEYRLGDLIGARNFLEQGRPYTRIPEEVSALEQLSKSLGPPLAEGTLENIECKENAAALHVRIGQTARKFLIPDFRSARDLQCGPQNGAPVRIEFLAMPLGTAGADGIVKSLEFR